MGKERAHEERIGARGERSWVVGIEGDQVRCVIFAIPPVRVVGHVPCLERGKRKYFCQTILTLICRSATGLQVEMKSEHFLWASLLMYGVPLLFFSLAIRSGKVYSGLWRLTGCEEAGGIGGRPVISLFELL